VAAYRAEAFGTSDTVIAEPRDGTWARGPHRLAPLPGHVVAAGGQFRLYSELYGVREGDPLNVELLIAPGREESLLRRLRELLDRRAALQVEYREEAAPEGGVVRAQREIGAELEPGGVRADADGDQRPDEREGERGGPPRGRGSEVGGERNRAIMSGSRSRTESRRGGDRVAATAAPHPSDRRSPAGPPPSGKSVARPDRLRLLDDAAVEEVDGALRVPGVARVVRDHADRGAALVELPE